jgi:hypothetical protein
VKNFQLALVVGGYLASADLSYKRKIPLAAWWLMAGTDLF